MRSNITLGLVSDLGGHMKLRTLVIGLVVITATLGISLVMVV